MSELIDHGTHFTFELHNENDAWNLFEIVRSDTFPDKLVIPEFVSWPNLNIKYWKNGQRAVLTAPMMEGLLNLQASIYRAFLIIEEETSSLRHLSEEQREKFEIGFKINEGSTEAEPKWIDIIEQLTKIVTSKINGKQATIIIISIALIYGGVTAWRAYLDHKAEITLIETKNKRAIEALQAQRQASDAELERFRILQEVMQESVDSKAILEASEEAKDGVLKSAKRVDSTQIGSNVIDPESAKHMSRIPRAHIQPEKISGTFEILRNDTTEKDGFRVRLKNLETEEKFFATLRDRLISPEDREIVSSAEWSKTPIWADISITRRRNEIIKAQILNVRKLDLN